MSKIFFDVFPTLKVNDEIRMLFESVQVEKVSTNRQRDFINVFLFSDHLIQKRHIYSMEGMIKDQLFARVPVRVTIFEHFQLSEQYTPENLMREYYDSLMLEVAQRSVVESKELLLTLDVSHIVARGRKGGSNVAAAICNAMLYQASNNARE